MSAEIHGIPHHAVRQWDADLRRANEIVIGGERLLIFSSYAIRHEQVAVADQLFRMARACGWTGPSPISMRCGRSSTPNAGSSLDAELGGDSS